MFSTIIQNNERTEQLNRRIHYRNSPGQSMNIQFDPRPQSTKYIQYPICNNAGENSMLYPIYDSSKHFNPGNISPYSGYAINVDTESKIHNIFMPYQKHAPQTYYIPSSTSTMYVPQHLDTNIPVKHYLLQKTVVFDSHNPDKNNINENANMFQLHTRQHEMNS
jgi:hypothetical protein